MARREDWRAWRVPNGLNPDGNGSGLHIKVGGYRIDRFSTGLTRFNLFRSTTGLRPVYLKQDLLRTNPVKHRFWAPMFKPVYDQFQLGVRDI